MFDGLGWGAQRHCRVVYVGAGLSALATVRSRLASGQAEANATRMRVDVSMTRAAILRRRTRIVANSAVASAALFRDGLLYAPHQPAGSGVQDKAHLVRVGRPARGPVTGKLVLVQLDQVLGIAPRAVINLVQVLRAGTVSEVTTVRMSMPIVLASILATTRRWCFQLFAP